MLSSVEFSSVVASPRAKGLIQQLGDRMQLPVEMADPFAEIDITGCDIDPDVLAELAPSAAVGDRIGVESGGGQMIRINLLPGGPKGRAAKPQYDVRAQALLGVGVILITLAGCWWYSASLDSELEARQEEKRDKEKQVAQLKEQVKTSTGF